MGKTNLVKVTDLTKFWRRLRFHQTALRDGYNKSGEFGENGEFDESDGFDEISPHV